MDHLLSSRSLIVYFSRIEVKPFSTGNAISKPLTRIGQGALMTRGGFARCGFHVAHPNRVIALALPEMPFRETHDSS